jgi:hypothetical protein
MQWCWDRAGTKPTARARSPDSSAVESRIELSGTTAILSPDVGAKDMTDSYEL